MHWNSYKKIKSFKVKMRQMKAKLSNARNLSIAHLITLHLEEWGNRHQRRSNSIWRLVGKIVFASLVIAAGASTEIIIMRRSSAYDTWRLVPGHPLVPILLRLWSPPLRCSTASKITAAARRVINHGGSSLSRRDAAWIYLQRKNKLNFF